MTLCFFLGRLFRAAEEARLPKRLKSDLGGALRDFTTREKHCFAQAKVSTGEGDDGGGSTLFTSQERQWLVLQVMCRCLFNLSPAWPVNYIWKIFHWQILQGLRAGLGDLEALQGKAAVAEGQSIIAAWQESGLITQVFPLHETTALTQLQSSWVRNIFAPQPLGKRNLTNYLFLSLLELPRRKHILEEKRSFFIHKSGFPKKNDPENLNGGTFHNKEIYE